MIRVIVAEDHALVREGMRRLLASARDIQVVAEAAHGSDVLDRCRDTPADLLLLDVSMPGPGFVHVLTQTRAQVPNLRVLVVSAHAEEQYAVRALREGASGYISKERSGDELLEAIRRVHRGGRYVSPALAEILAQHIARDGSIPLHEQLSRREYEVLCHLGAGRTMKDIAALMKISPKTVSTYRRRLLDKLSLETTGDLVRYAVEHGLRP